MNAKRQIFNFLIVLSVGGFAYLSNGYLGVTQAAYHTPESVLSNPTNAIPAKQPLLEKVAELIPDTFPRIKDRTGNFYTDTTYNPFNLSDPAAIKRDIRYDADLGLYVITETIGGVNYRPPMYMTFEEYLKYSQEKEQMDYFRSLNKKANNSIDPIDQFDLAKPLEERTIFGGEKIDIRPNGNIDMTFGADFQRIDNPVIPERQRRQGGFDFDMNIQMNVIGKIGDKMNLSTNYNTQASFDFDNQVKLEYKGHPDEILKSVTAGTVSLPLRSQLIQGSQSLLGIKTEMQFGRLTVTSIMSQQRSRRQNLTIQGGSQLQEFEVTADNYDENRHFFLSHYNRGDYERALGNLPQINTLFKITKMEVWVTNTRGATQGVRDIIAIADLGEADRDKMAVNNPNLLAPITPVFRDLYNNGLPSDSANVIYQEILNTPLARNLNTAVATLQGPQFNMQQVRDFEKVRARKLQQSEFTFHPDLGYISLNFSMQPEDVLGVSFEYTYNGRTYRVGEFAQESPTNPDTLSVLVTKMLKSSSPRVDLPIWDLMMKNIYSLGAYQIGQDEFKLDLLYQDPEGGVKPFLPGNTSLSQRQLISVLNLDNLNRTGDPIPDGVFDWVDGLTINPRNGRITFPVLEPFGSSLQKKFDPITELDISQQFVYHQLYDSTVIVAREYPEYNRFIIKGTYRSSVSSEISLGAFNIPRNSVTVRAGGAVLVEGQDYEVDYNIGRIKILNEGILNSGAQINVSYEDNSLFSFQTRTMVGTRLDYWISDNFTIGGTYLRLSERPFTQKVNFGDDPIRNSVYGLDLQYSSDAPWLTKLVDKIPLIQTKEKSNISLVVEGAWLKPGHNKIVELDGEGTVYIDDFEGSSTFFDLRTPANVWSLASIPRTGIFPEADLVDSLASGVNRAKLSWYQIDQNLRNGSETNPYERLVREQEVFPNKQLLPGQNIDIRPLDLAYYPNKRGPYNFDVFGIPGISAGMNANGDLNQPQTRWGGIMRSLQTNNFEQANIEFIEIWVLSPFIDGVGGQGGDLYIDLGNVSEDILRDSRNFYENGLPGAGSTSRVDTTSWSRIPRTQAITNAFDNNEETRALQDVGLDGVNDQGEANLFKDFLDQVKLKQPFTENEITADPSADNFLYYNDPSIPQSTTILERYSKFNSPEGNSEPSTQGVLSSSTNIPDSEDINRDNTLNESEAFFEYRIPIQPDPAQPGMMLENEFVTNTIETIEGERWYQLKIPIDQFSKRVGGIQDFRSIRFMRLYMTGFDEPVVLRMARLALVRNQWRRYRRSLTNSGLFIVPDDEDNTVFDLNAVNIEENSAKFPFPYVLPPGISREQTVGTITNALQNEQALSLNICDLQDGDARGVYKIVNLDMRTFKELKMSVHAEDPSQQTKPGDLSIFMRLGSDFEDNYYEYEIPLTMTPPDAAPVTPDPNDDEDYKQQVWLSENEIFFALEQLKNIKIDRNNKDISLATLYEIQDPDKPNNKIKIKGNPTLGLVKGIMIGLRNTNGQGVPQCAEVWVNELRVSGFDERGGVAGLARLDVKLADLGTVTASTNYTSIGYGSIDQKLAQRAKEEVFQYDIATSIELGRFLPKKSGIQIPFYTQLSRTIKTPQFDPYQLDIPLRELLDGTPDLAEREEIKRNAQNYTSIRSINFTNVRKQQARGATKPMPWAISNFNATYAFTQTYKRDPNIESELLNLHRGALNYAYGTQPKYITPFKKLIKNKPPAPVLDGEEPKKIWIKDKEKTFALIREFNFNLVPSSMTFSSNMIRRYAETTYRFADDTWYDKRFTWDRTYGLQWKLAKNLDFNFNANNMAVIDEPFGEVTTAVRDSIVQGLLDFGRNKNYTHTFNASYTVPFKQIGILDWIQVRAQMNSNYSWSAASLNTIDLGNIIQNGQSRQLNGDMDFVKLYNKSTYLKKINSRPAPTRAGDKRVDRTAPREGNLPNKALEVDKKKAKERVISKQERAFIRPLLSVRQLKVTYSEDLSTVLPGFLPTTAYIGMDETFTSPGVDFIAGFQPSTAWLDRAAAKNWITDDIFLNQQFIQDSTQTMDIRLTLEPFTDFRIDVTANKSFSKNHTEFFKLKDLNSTVHEHLSSRDMGNYSITFFSLNTMFVKFDEKSNTSTLFKAFEENRAIISERLGISGLPHEVDGGYKEGYGRFQQDVLIPSFIAAYTEQSPTDIKLNLFDRLPMPNWRLTYNGLNKLDIFKDIFSSINISHGYSSKLNVNSFITDMDYDPNDPFRFNPITLNYFTEFEIPDLVITEQLQPLIGIDVRLKNEMTARLDFKKSRTLAMNFRDYQLSETQTTEFTIGFGYRIKNYELPFGKNKGKTDKKGKEEDKKDAPKIDNPALGKTSGGGSGNTSKDLDIKFDFSFRDDLTVNHVLDQETSQVTRGLTTIRISPNINYQVNSRLNLRLFFDQSRTIPKTSASFPITNTQAGLTVRFSLAP
jgi:cell surface protein SprA